MKNTTRYGNNLCYSCVSKQYKCYYNVTVRCPRGVVDGSWGKDHIFHEKNGTDVTVPEEIVDLEEPQVDPVP